MHSLMRQLLLSPMLIRGRSYLSFEQAKANEWELHGKLAETKVVVKKLKDGMSLLEKKKVSDLDVVPQVIEKK